MKIAPEGWPLLHSVDEIVPGTKARVRMSDSNVVEPDCGHKARGVPGRWFCLQCSHKFEINDATEPGVHASENPDHAFSWQCFVCGKLVAVRTQ